MYIIRITSHSYLIYVLRCFVWVLLSRRLRNRRPWPVFLLIPNEKKNHRYSDPMVWMPFWKFDICNDHPPPPKSAFAKLGTIPVMRTGEGGGAKWVGPLWGAVYILRHHWIYLLSLYTFICILTSHREHKSWNEIINKLLVCLISPETETRPTRETLDMS